MEVKIKEALLAREFEKHSKDAVSAIKENDLQKVQSAIGAIGQSCDKCHGDWR